MNANSIKNLTLFLLSAGCVTLIALLTHSRQEHAKNATGNGPNGPPPISSDRQPLPDALHAFLEKARNPGSFEKWDVTKAQAQRQELVSVINSLNGPQRDALREEIAKANWVLEVLETRAAKAPFSEVDLVSRLVTFKTLSQSPPEGVSQDLTSSVAEGLRQTIAALRAKLDETIIELKDGKRVDDERLRAARLTTELLDESDVPGVGGQGDAINAFLSLSEWEKMAKERAVAVSELQSPDGLPARRIAGLIVEGQATCERIDELGYTVPKRVDDNLDGLRSLLSKSAADSQRKLSSTYQTWALKNIEEVTDLAGTKAADSIGELLSKCKNDPGQAAKDSTFGGMVNAYPTFRTELAKQTGLDFYRGREPIDATWQHLKSTAEKLNTYTGWKGQDELAKALVKDLIVVKLLVIDESLLERPVASLYSEAFEACWKYLEGTPHRVAIAKDSATIVKQKPEDVKP